MKAPFGAEVIGVDLKQSLDGGTKTAINRAFADNGVLVFRGQSFATPDQFLAAATNLGEPMPPVVATYRLPGYEAIEELTNTATDTRTGEKTLLYRGGSWHTDHSNLACPPKATTLYAIDLPPSGGGNTEFINMMMAYEALDPATRETLRGRRAFQAYISRRAPRKLLARTDAEKQGSDGVWQPMVRRHPETGRAALYLNPMRCDAVEEMEQAEGDVLLDALYAHADQTQFQYSHGWSAGDMLIWDNRSCLHQATPVRVASERRYMHRIMLRGDAPIMAG
ncbi:MAG: TauD/TfdA family dioxygenase [Rhodospirillaceae bacterium]|nr:TauD/TfdA family dioxygenase [Rhodospirillaceae bacterium]MBT5458951.1 TauD/TfdA family dioxygenase [Rhodospirillaceae bacterium]